MRKFSKLAAGSAILATAALATAGTALADGYASKGRVVYERPTDWGGVYFGVHSGYSFSDYDARSIPFGTRYSVSPDAGILGAHLGAQHQFGSIVLGVEGNWTSAIRDEYDSTFCPNPAARCQARFDDVLSVGPRIGVAAGHWMPYVTGGYASARFEAEFRNTATGVLTSSSASRHQGWYIGGGAEWKVSPNWTAGVEYRHYELNDAIYDFRTPLGALVPADQLRSDVTLDTITARVSWKFGRPEAKPLK